MCNIWSNLTWNPVHNNFCIQFYLNPLSPSRSAHNSASTLVAIPIALANPPTQVPLRFYRIPPPPAKPGLSKAEPLVFSLIQFGLGFSPLTLAGDFPLVSFTLPAQEKNSAAKLFTSFTEIKLSWLGSKILLLHFCQKNKNKNKRRRKSKFWHICLKIYKSN